MGEERCDARAWVCLCALRWRWSTGPWGIGQQEVCAPQRVWVQDLKQLSG